MSSKISTVRKWLTVRETVLSQVRNRVEGSNEAFPCPKVSHAIQGRYHLRLSGEILRNIVCGANIALSG